jgi:ligand-binding SRPBCC domain-containing protein
LLRSPPFFMPCTILQTSRKFCACFAANSPAERISKQKMKTEIFIRRSRIEASAADVYAWHALPDALEKLTPPGEDIDVIERTGGIERGAKVVIRFGRWPFRMRWVAVHQEYEAGRYFSDLQVSGPFAYWKHTHSFEPGSAAACTLEDKVEYALPFGFLGRWIAGSFVRRKIEEMFEYRHAVTARLMASERSSTGSSPV